MQKIITTKYKMCILTCLSSIILSTTAFSFLDYNIKIEIPISGLHTRKNSIPLRGAINDSSIKTVKITLDGSTVQEMTIPCINGNFEAELLLAAGKTTISVWAKNTDGKTTESGVVVYRDCTISTVINTYKCFVNSSEESLLNSTLLITNRSFVALREFATFFGASITYNPRNKQIGLTIGRRKSLVTIGNETAIIGDKKVICKPAPILFNNVAYIPARFFAEMISGGVAWHSGSRTLVVSVP